MKPVSSPNTSRCFVHIGAPKTGTTFLQQLCWENREALLHAGILYPEAGARRGGHHDYAFLMAGGYPDWATPQPRDLTALECDLQAELMSQPHCDVLLSSEDFYMFPHPEKLRATLERTGALSGRKPEIILYLRRQDAAHESWYNQTIKALGYHHTIDESLVTFHDLWDYDANLNRWSTVFGNDALNVRIYEDNAFTGGTLASDFLNVLGLEPSAVSVPAEKVNTGLNYDLLEIQRQLNKLPLSVQQKRRFHKDMIDLSMRTKGTGLFDESPVIDAARARAIMQSYAEGNERVARRYFGRTELFDVEAQIHDSEGQRSGVTVDKMMHLLGWILTRNA